MIQQQHKRLKCPPISRDPQPKRRQLPRPQRLLRRGKHTGQLIEITGRDKSFVRVCLPGPHLTP